MASNMGMGFGLDDFIAADIDALLSPNGSTDTFEWTSCSYALHSDEGHPWPAAPKMVGCPTPLLMVQMAKTPPRVDGSFRWHKNCVLPRLQVSVQGVAIGESFAVLLSAVSVDVLTHTAQSVGLEGDCLRPIVNGTCTFSSLAFKTTSYNLPGRPPLHLMITLLTRQQPHMPAGPLMQGYPSGTQMVVTSIISPAITVDARKRQPKGANAIVSTLHPAPADEPSSHKDTAPEGQGASLLPFAPDMLERKLEKVGKEAPRLAIGNSIDGLRAYLSALNIRNKCKHPLFLVLRFDACVGLLYDTSCETNPANDDDAFFLMMSSLSPNATGQSVPPTVATGSAGGFPPYVVAVKSSHEAHACGRADCPIKLSAAVSLPHSNSLPSSYRLLGYEEVALLRRTYCRLYCKHGRQTIIRPTLANTELSEQICGKIENPSVKQNPDAVGEEEKMRTLAQKYASSLHTTVKQMAQSSCEAADGMSSDGCPEREWEMSMLLLAEAITMHCRTRSASEVLAFMQDTNDSANKRLMSISP